MRRSALKDRNVVDNIYLAETLAACQKHALIGVFTANNDYIRAHAIQGQGH